MRDNGLNYDGSGKGPENESDLGGILKFWMISHANKFVNRI